MSALLFFDILIGFENFSGDCLDPYETPVQGFRRFVPLDGQEQEGALYDVMPAWFSSTPSASDEPQGSLESSKDI